MAHLATAGSADPARLGHNTTTRTRRKKRDNTRDGAREGGTTGAFNSKNGRGDRKKSGRRTLRRDIVASSSALYSTSTKQWKYSPRGHQQGSRPKKSPRSNDDGHQHPKDATQVEVRSRAPKSLSLFLSLSLSLPPSLSLFLFLSFSLSVYLSLPRTSPTQLGGKVYCR